MSRTLKEYSGNNDSWYFDSCAIVVLSGQRRLLFTATEKRCKRNRSINGTLLAMFQLDSSGCIVVMACCRDIAMSIHETTEIISDLLNSDHFGDLVGLCSISAIFLGSWLDGL